MAPWQQRAHDQALASLAAGRLGYVQVISGRLAVNGVELSAGDGAKIAEESALHFMATDEAEILLFDLPPHQ